VDLDPVVDRVAVGGRDAPPIAPLESFDGLPPEAREQAPEQGSDGSDVSGVFHEVPLCLVGDRRTNRTDAGLEGMILQGVTGQGPRQARIVGVDQALSSTATSWAARPNFEPV
jgi:hypothetical protein